MKHLSRIQPKGPTPTEWIDWNYLDHTRWCPIGPIVYTHHRSNSIPRIFRISIISTMDGGCTFIELDDGKIYRKALYLMVKTMVSCRFSLKPTQWHLWSCWLKASFESRNRSTQGRFSAPQASSGLGLMVQPGRVGGVPERNPRVYHAVVKILTFSHIFPNGNSMKLSSWGKKTLATAPVNWHCYGKWPCIDYLVWLTGSVASHLPPSVKISYAHMLYSNAGLVPPVHYITGYLHAVFTTASHMPIQSIYNVLLPMKYLHSSHKLATIKI